MQWLFFQNIYFGFVTGGQTLRNSLESLQYNILKKYYFAFLLHIIFEILKMRAEFSVLSNCCPFYHSCVFDTEEFFDNMFGELFSEGFRGIFGQFVRQVIDGHHINSMVLIGFCSLTCGRVVAENRFGDRGSKKC